MKLSTLLKEYVDLRLEINDFEVDNDGVLHHSLTDKAETVLNQIDELMDLHMKPIDEFPAPDQSKLYAIINLDGFEGRVVEIVGEILDDGMKSVEVRSVDDARPSFEYMKVDRANLTSEHENISLYS